MSHLGEGAVASLEKIDIDDLRPTQFSLGLAEVRRRAKAMRTRSKEQLDKLVEEKAIPYVIGPKREIYMVDHHHFCRAILRAGRQKVLLGSCFADLSQLDPKRFWLDMEQRGYCWPFDAEGNRRPFAKIPHHVKDLTDNPWRTLARGVRGRAYSNEDTPFQEFMWGNYFRSFMSQRLLEVNLALAEDLAVRLARLDEAQDLPGYYRRPETLDAPEAPLLLPRPSDG